MTDAELDAIEARANAATVGPWTCDTKRPDDVVVWGPRKDGDDRMFFNVGGQNPSEVGVVYDCDAKDGEFVAYARTDVPALVAEVRRLRAKLDDAAIEAMGEDA